MTSTIKTEYYDGVLVATYDNPRSELNLIDEEAHEDWLAFISGVRRDDQAKVIVLQGKKNVFTGGGDFAMFERLGSDESGIDQLRRDARIIVWDFVNIEQPIIFAGQGPAVGLGATIALLCDFIVLGRDAQIIDPHVKVGLAAGDGGTAIWPLVMGHALAKRYLLTGAPLTASDAEKYGIAAKVCDAKLVSDEAMKLARNIAAQPELATKYTKIALNGHIRRALVDSFDLSSALETVNFFTNEHKNAFENIKSGGTR